MKPSTIGNESIKPGTRIDNNANPETAVKQPIPVIKPTKK